MKVLIQKTYGHIAALLVAGIVAYNHMRGTQLDPHSLWSLVVIATALLGKSHMESR